MRGATCRLWLCATGMVGGLAGLPERADAQYSLAQLKELFQAGVRADAVLETARAKCLAFRIGANEEQELVSSGATARVVAQLRGICLAGDVAPVDSAATPPGTPAPAGVADTAWVPDPNWTDQPRVLGPDTSETARRKQALMAALTEGAEAIKRNDHAAAFSAWDRVIELDPQQMGLLITRANLQIETGQLDGALATYRRLYTAGAGTGVTPAQQLDWKSKGLDGMLWTASRYAERLDPAGQQAALRQVLEIDPGNVSALQNLLARVYGGKDWAALLPLLDGLHEMHPLDHNRRMMRYFANMALAEATGDPEGAAAKAYKALAEQARAAADSLPVRLNRLQLQYGDGRATLSGDLVGGSLPAGSSLVLAVTYTSPDGVVGEQTVTIPAPAAGQTVPFSTTLAAAVRPTGFRYRVP